MKINLPKISIITPSFNRAGMISDAIESVLAQDYPNFEHIIVDGASTDETLDVLRKYSHLKIVSAPDQGMYDAINKGLDLASGEIIGILNSDDSYNPDVFAHAINLLENSNADAVAGQAIYFLKTKNHKTTFFRQSVLLTEQAFWHELTYGDPVFNAWFFHRRVFDIIGKLDTSYQIAGDRDFLLRFALSKLKHIPLEKVVYRYRVHDGSLSLTPNLLSFSRVADENLRLVEHYLDILPLKAQADMKRIRTRETITAASRNLRGGAFKHAFHYIKFGCQKDAFWLIKFFFRITTGIFRATKRKFGMYS